MGCLLRLGYDWKLLVCESGRGYELCFRIAAPHPGHSVTGGNLAPLSDGDSWRGCGEGSEEYAKRSGFSVIAIRRVAAAKAPAELC